MAEGRGLKPSPNFFLNGFAIFVSINSLFNALSVAFGDSLFTNTFLMPPHDLFGDYFNSSTATAGTYGAGFLNLYGEQSNFKNNLIVNKFI